MAQDLTDKFTPTTPPGAEDPEALRRWIAEEFRRLSSTLQETVALDLRPVYREPTRPRAGMIVYADGTSWNPGAGEGVYTYTIAGAWSKL